ncbi:MAG: glutathione synthase [Rhodospirillaceae bacterium]|nr:glutathione synthase [Rhodospirillaceae bacterium]OUU28818.1 MAG: glutathione synthase [Candidatus Endolissoclinum sp. TMED37]
MTLKVAFQMDPMESIDIAGDSSFALALEAQERGHKLFHYEPKNLSLSQLKPVAKLRSLTVQNITGNHFSLGEQRIADLKTDIDVILMRQDPPFDMSYITATHILEHVHPHTLVINNPTNVRNTPEKLFVTHFENVMPPTLITSDEEEIFGFRKEFKDIIVKPLFGNGGAGVFHIKPNDENLSSLIELHKTFYREPLMIQEYVPAVRQGDKRIILIDGKPVGAVNRVPAKGEARSNMHVGGKPMKCELTARDREICEIIGPSLKEKGLLFVGIDVIGNYLTEINVTSPTGIKELSRFEGTNIASLIWDAIEKKL